MSEHVLRKKTYMQVGQKAADSNNGVTLHGVVGIRVVKNERVNSRQKRRHYDTIEIDIVKEDAFGRKSNFSITLFGKEEAQL